MMKTKQYDMLDRAIRIGIWAICLSLCANTKIYAKEWKTAVSGDKAITVDYIISTRLNESGDKVPLIESVISTNEDIAIEKFIAILKNVPKHKDFRGDEASEVIEKISENEWIIYYYSEKTLVSPEIDGVYRMTFDEDNEHKTAFFEIKAEPTLIEKKTARRITYSRETFSFKEIGNGRVEITVNITMSPGFKVPLWIMRQAFPNQFFVFMRKFIEMARNE